MHISTVFEPAEWPNEELCESFAASCRYIYIKGSFLHLRREELQHI